MASVLIKGLKMPINCWFCSVKSWDDDEYVCPFSGRTVKSGDANRHEDCPLIPIPDHGDLIDRDEAADDACLIWGRNSSGDDAAQEIIEHLRKMKAVIPAERSEE